MLFGWLLGDQTDGRLYPLPTVLLPFLQPAHILRLLLTRLKGLIRSSYKSSISVF